MTSLNPFTYPSEPHVRKHGPAGYKSYESYRPWLRDEFTFRCIFCLCREQWGLIRGSFDIDHFVPQSQDPAGGLSYDNLLYACRSCNLGKSSNLLPDPCRIAFGKCLSVGLDGGVVPLNDEGQILVDTLRLNNQDYTHFRRLILGIVNSLVRSRNRSDHHILSMLMSYPDNLPDLSSLRPPRNNRPEGVKESYLARRAAGTLPAYHH